ncbi:MAG: TonB-dependent receptor plug domain-containing protein, partial [Verrucomicrobiota bacterium]
MNYRTQNRNTLPLACRKALVGVLAVGIAFPALAQDDEEDDIFELSPFEVSGEDSTGYRATSTLAGTRLRTELKDVGSAIQAVTKEFMEDIGATDNTTLLQYTTNTEVAGTEGNFAGVGNDQTLGENSRMRNPHSSTRVRGLQQADNARDFYQSVIPWDGYNVERVDIQRGANSILFGLGSPAGIVNADIADANFGRENGKIGLRFDEHGSVRTTFDYNKVLLEDELAVRVSILNDNEKYQQRYAFEDDQRLFVAMRYEPSFLKSERTRTSIRAKYEDGSIERNSPRILPPVDLMTPFFNDDQLGKVGIIPRRADDGNSRLPGHGITDEFYDDNVTPNPYYNPWVGSFAQVHGGLVYVFDDPVTGSIQDVFDSTPKTDGGIDSTGAIDATLAVGGRLKGIENYGDWTKAVSLPGSEKGLYKDTHITDTSIFDYYNNLLEGPNKGVTAEFDAKNIVLEQTFFNNSLGFEFAYDEQTYADEQLTI